MRASFFDLAVLDNHFIFVTGAKVAFVIECAGKSHDGALGGIFHGGDHQVMMVFQGISGAVLDVDP